MKDKKVDHQVEYHKPSKNPTTNYPKDGHDKFCKRCMRYNGYCKETGGLPSSKCNI